MQALTPEQTQFVHGVFHEAIDKAVWALVAWGGWRLRKLIKSVRPGIVSDVVAAVNHHADARMQAHEEKDDSRFAALEEKQDTQFAELARRISAINPLRHREHGHASAAIGD